MAMGLLSRSVVHLVNALYVVDYVLLDDDYLVVRLRFWISWLGDTCAAVSCTQDPPMAFTLHIHPRHLPLRPFDRPLLHNHFTDFFITKTLLAHHLPQARRPLRFKP